jgi:hypothetical protein
MGIGFRVQGSGFVRGSGFEVQGSGFEVQSTSFSLPDCKIAAKGWTLNPEL